MNTATAPLADKNYGRMAWILVIVAWIVLLLPLPQLSLVGWGLNLGALVLAIMAIVKQGASKGIWQLLGALIVSPLAYFLGLMLMVGLSSPLATDPVKVDLPAQAVEGR